MQCGAQFPYGRRAFEALGRWCGSAGTPPSVRHPLGSWPASCSPRGADHCRPRRSIRRGRGAGGRSADAAGREVDARVRTRRLIHGSPIPPEPESGPSRGPCRRQTSPPIRIMALTCSGTPGVASPEVGLGGGRRRGIPRAARGGRPPPRAGEILKDFCRSVDTNRRELAAHSTGGVRNVSW